MKNKYFLSIIIIGGIVLSSLFAEVDKVNAVPSADESIKVCCIQDADHNYSGELILSEPDINFSEGTVKISRYDNTKTHEKSSKYKLPLKENHKIEHRVESYIFYVGSLTHRYLDNLSKLRRLNI